MKRAYSVLNIKQVDDDQRIITGVATTPAPDRMGDIVEPLGIKFKNPLPLLWQHQSQKPVGLVKFDPPTKDGITFTATLPKTDEPGAVKDRVDEAWQSVKLGLVRAVSIGFRELEYTYMDDGGVRFVESEVLELSLVTIPANAEATIQQIRSIDEQTRAAAGRTGEDIERKQPSAGVTASKPTVVVKAQEAKRTMKKTIPEQISSFEATRQAKAARMQEIMDASGETGATLDAAQQQEYDTLRDEVKSIDDHLVRLNEMKEMNLAAATAVAGTDTAAAAAARGGTRVTVTQPKKLEPGIKFARFVRAMASSRGVRSDAIEFIKANDRWMNETPDLVDIVRAAVTAGNTQDTAWAGPLVNYQVMASEFADYLRPLTIIGRIPGLRIVPFNVKIQRQTSGSTVNWVGEGAPKPMSQLAFDLVSLTYSKIAGIVALTDELVKLSNPSADQLVRDDLTKAIVQFMDSQFVDPSKAAVSQISPASITNGVTPIIATGTTAAALRTDLITLTKQFLANNLSLANCVFIMTQQQALAISLMVTSLGVPLFPNISAQGGSLVGIPVITSENVPATGGSPTDGGLIILAKADEIMLADDGNVTIDASKEASLQMDSAPDSPATASTTFVSMFQQNMVAIRAERYINWVKRRSTAVGYIQNANYAA